MGWRDGSRLSGPGGALELPDEGLWAVCRKSWSCGGLEVKVIGRCCNSPGRGKGVLDWAHLWIPPEPFREWITVNLAPVHLRDARGQRKEEEPSSSSGACSAPYMWFYIIS